MFLINEVIHCLSHTRRRVSVLVSSHTLPVNFPCTVYSDSFSVTALDFGIHRSIAIFSPGKFL